MRGVKLGMLPTEPLVETFSSGCSSRVGAAENDAGFVAAFDTLEPVLNLVASCLSGHKSARCTVRPTGGALGLEIRIVSLLHPRIQKFISDVGPLV